jgi:DNA-binding transcriptional MerR regulator
MLTIGEFSQTVQLSIKTLRYYHEIGLLFPEHIDETSGYRYYDHESFIRASAIITLKQMGFTLSEIKDVFTQCETDNDVGVFIRNKIQETRKKIEKLTSLEQRLLEFESMTAREQTEGSSLPEEIEFSLPHYGAVPCRGTYDRIGEGLSLLYKHLGFSMIGKAYGFYYDMEYKEADANFEAVVEIKKPVTVPGIICRSMASAPAVTLLHKGPYGTQGSSYLSLFNYCRARGYTIKPPLVEQYIKGPGIVLKGNPKHYLTRITVLVDRE